MKPRPFPFPWRMSVSSSKNPFPGSTVVLCASLYNTLKALCIPVRQYDSHSRPLHYQYSLGQLAVHWHLSNHPQSISVTLYEWQSLPRLPELLTICFRHLSFQTVCPCCLSVLIQSKYKLFVVVLLNLLSSCLMFSSKWDLFKAGSPPSSKKGEAPMVLRSLL